MGSGGCDTEITRTITCRLKTSNRKNAKLQRAVSDFRRAAEVTANVLPSFPRHARQRNNTQIYRTVKSELDDYAIKDKVVQNAVHRVIANYTSAAELGHELPKRGIADCDFLILTNQGYDIEPNGRGYGLKAKFIPYKPEWWHLDIGDHQRQYLDRALDGDARPGAVELAHNDASPVARVGVNWEVSVAPPRDATHVIGVDIGLRSLYSVAVRDRERGDIVDVSVESGAEFRHTRTRHDERAQQCQRDGRHEQAAAHRESAARYTEDRLHTAAKRIVARATDYEKALIRVEAIDPSNFADGTDHNWPFRSLLDKIEAKATEAGVPLETVEPHHTSQMCRECGYTDPENRAGDDFECLHCSYAVHADVNAAMNIAMADAR